MNPDSMLTKIPEKWTILNGQVRRYLVKRGGRAYICIQEGKTRYKWIVMERIVDGMVEKLQDCQRYKVAEDRMQAEQIFQAIEWGEIDF